MSVDSSISDRPLRDVDTLLVATLCAEAAWAWYRAQNRSEALKRLMMAMSKAARHCRGELPARKPHEMLALFERPMSCWLDGGANEPLIEDDGPSCYCEDLLAEAGSQPEAELIQGQINEARLRFMQRATGEEEYRKLRRFLIEHGHVEHGHAQQSEAERQLIRAGLPFDRIYEPISGNRRVHRNGREVFYPCRQCRWPMLVRTNVVSCAAPPCREAGARFRNDKDTLVALGPLPAPTQKEIVDHFMLRRAIWRYTLLPGLTELDLDQKLRRLQGVRVTLWPRYDQYDLHINFGKRESRVDVKDWSDPLALARRLQVQSPPANVTIVIPDRRQPQLHVLRERCPTLEFRTVSQLVAQIRRATGEEAP